LFNWTSDVHQFCLLEMDRGDVTDVRVSLEGKRHKSKMRSRSKRAGLQFPVSRVERYLRKGRYANQIGAGAAVYLAAVLEYLVLEIIELAGDASHANKRKMISPRHIQLAIGNDEELNTLLSDIIIPAGGVIPHVESSLNFEMYWQ
uniref:Histone H2A n=1 Tax=Parascaris univalens TaxID=6257 RepID=A0A915BUC8_PARUN